MFNIPVPLKREPVLKQEEFDTSLAGGASAQVVGRIKVPQGVSLVEAFVGAQGGTDAGGYFLRGVVKNVESLRTAAAQTLTVASANFSAAETVTIGSTVYTFRASVTTTAYEVKVGTNATESLTNLKNAINGGTGSGTTYGSLTVAHPSVTAVSSDATTLVINAKTKGTAGNSIATTETCSTVSWGASTMAGGVDASTLVGSVTQVVGENDSGWDCTMTVNGATDTLEVKGTADSAATTRFAGFVQLYPLS